MIKLKELLDINYKSVDLFSESPMRVKSWNEDILNSLSGNYTFTVGLKERAKSIGMFDKYDIYEYTNGNYIIDCFVKDDYTLSFFQYKINGDLCEIHKVWQDSTHLGLNRNIIFEYYLKKYTSISTDEIHTELGEKSVKKLLKSAKDLNYKIYVLKNNKEKTEIIDLNDIDKYYSHGTDGLQYKFMISKK